MTNMCLEREGLKLVRIKLFSIWSSFVCLAVQRHIVCCLLLSACRHAARAFWTFVARNCCEFGIINKSWLLSNILQSLFVEEIDYSLKFKPCLLKRVWLIVFFFSSERFWRFRPSPWWTGLCFFRKCLLFIVGTVFMHALSLWRRVRKAFLQKTAGKANCTILSCALFFLDSNFKLSSPAKRLQNEDG